MDKNTPRDNEETSSSGQNSHGGKPDTEYYFTVVTFKVRTIWSTGNLSCTIQADEQVENTIFRVPRNGFDVPGTIFEAMFSLPVEGDNMQGSSDSNPIILPVSEEHFRGFLRAMYPFK